MEIIYANHALRRIIKMEKVIGYRVIFDIIDNGIDIYYEEMYDEFNFLFKSQKARVFDNEKEALEFYHYMLDYYFIYMEKVELLKQEIFDIFNQKKI